MYCRYCGKELPNSSNFCPNCGEKQKDDNSRKKTVLKDFLKGHKIIIYAYLVWFLLHLTLFQNSTKNKPDGFYPWDESISYLLEDGSYYHFSLLDEYNVYDFSELFFYTILFPIITFGLVRLFLHFYPSLKKLKFHYKHWQVKDAKNKEEYQGIISGYKVQQKDEMTNEPLTERPVVEEVVNSDQQISDKDSEETAIREKKSASIEVQSQKEQPQEDMTNIESDVEVKKMPLFSRLIGSIIDKILILIIFVVGFVVVSPYGAPGMLGTYVGLRNTPLSLYEYVDRYRMNNYDTYYEGVSKGYQDLARLETEPPHIGSTLELDLNITFSFIFLNLLFYVLFESILYASPGKRILGGIIFDGEDDKICFGRVLLRGLCRGVLMVGTYFLLHLQGGLANTVVVVVFFLILDLPVLFTKKSLIDLCTGTTYVKRKTIQL